MEPHFWKLVTLSRRAMAARRSFPGGSPLGHTGRSINRATAAYAKHGASHKSVLKLREDMAAIFVTFKLPLPLTDVLVKNLRDVLASIKEEGLKAIAMVGDR